MADILSFFCFVIAYNHIPFTTDQKSFHSRIVTTHFSISE